MTTPDLSPLGRDSAYPSIYDRSVLFAIDRRGQRSALGLAGPLPFRGEDIWTGYELSWLDSRGKPQVAIATVRVPASSPFMVESKSLKLYLNGFAQMRHDAAEAVRVLIAADLSETCAAPVSVELVTGAALATQAINELEGDCIDDLPISIDSGDEPLPALLRADGEPGQAQCLVTRLFRSNCPVTGQPDWADVQVRCRGRALDAAGLLGYLVSFRQHQGFHEQCVERIFLDIQQRCQPETLTVYARFTRRGGLDINPWRSNDPQFAAPANTRTPRQ